MPRAGAARELMDADCKAQRISLWNAPLMGRQALAASGKALGVRVIRAH